MRVCGTRILTAMSLVAFLCLVCICHHLGSRDLCSDLVYAVVPVRPCVASLCLYLYLSIRLALCVDRSFFHRQQIIKATFSSSLTELSPSLVFIWKRTYCGRRRRIMRENDWVTNIARWSGSWVMIIFLYCAYEIFLNIDEMRERQLANYFREDYWSESILLLFCNDSRGFSKIFI